MENNSSFFVVSGTAWEEISKHIYVDSLLSHSRTGNNIFNINKMTFK